MTCFFPFCVSTSGRPRLFNPSAPGIDLFQGNATVRETAHREAATKCKVGRSFGLEILFCGEFLLVITLLARFA